MHTAHGAQMKKPLGAHTERLSTFRPQEAGSLPAKELAGFYSPCLTSPAWCRIGPYLKPCLISRPRVWRRLCQTCDACAARGSWNHPLWLAHQRRPRTQKAQQQDRGTRPKWIRTQRYGSVSSLHELLDKQGRSPCSIGRQHRRLCRTSFEERACGRFNAEPENFGC